MNTNEVAAVSRLVEFNGIITDANPNTVYKILELTKNSYYKIILKETSSATILEILNGKIYSISTPVGSAKEILIEASSDNDILYISKFSGNVSCLIDYYEKFNLKVETAAEKVLISYDTDGRLKLINFTTPAYYTDNFTATNFSPDQLTVKEQVNLGSWKITVSGSDLSIGI